MPSTSERIQKQRQAVTLSALEHAYTEAREKRPEPCLDFSGVVTECVRDQRTFFGLAADQVKVLTDEAKGRTLSNREYIKMALSEQAFTLRRKAAGATPPPPATRYTKPHPDGELRTTARLPISEIPYVLELADVVGTSPRALATCVNDTMTFFGVDPISRSYLEAEAEAMKLDNREYIQTVLSERAFELRLAQEKGGPTLKTK